MTNSLKENLELVHSKIRSACERVGRDPSEVKLIAVSKTFPVEDIDELVGLGQLDIGENRVQELTRKMSDSKTKPRWHMIGHLQTNKVKYICDEADMIHSVSSIRLAREINKRTSKIMDVLIQVNVAGEEQKQGIAPTQLPQLLEEMAELENIRIVGLMNIALNTEDESLLRKHYGIMRELFQGLSQIKQKNLQPIYLSMGMSNDFEVAIEEGSNMVRVGSKIFGRRK